MDRKAALTKAITLAGSQTELGRVVGKNQGHVSAWIRRDHKVPADLVLPICSKLGGQITPFELRPDVFGSSLDDLLKAVCP